MSESPTAGSPSMITRRRLLACAAIGRPARCEIAEPALRPAGENHSVACHYAGGLPEEINGEGALS